MPLINGMELDMDVTDLATQMAWKLRNNKARSDIVLNLTDALKLMYEHLDKATIVVLNNFFSKLEMKNDENVTSFLEKNLSLTNQLIGARVIYFDDEITL